MLKQTLYNDLLALAHYKIKDSSLASFDPLHPLTNIGAVKSEMGTPRLRIKILK